MHNKSYIKQMGITFFQHFMTSLIITLKKLIQFGKAVQIRQLQQRDFEMIRVVEGCFSALVHELTPFLFLLSLHKSLSVKLIIKSGIVPADFICVFVNIEDLKPLVLSCAMGVGTSRSPGVLWFLSWLLTSVTHASGDSSLGFDFSLSYLCVHTY